MSCPVCDNTEYTEISGGWRDRKVARCDVCGNVFDHLFTESDSEGDSSQTVNCLDCGSPNAGSRSTCSYCGERLGDVSE